MIKKCNLATKSCNLYVTFNVTSLGENVTYVTFSRLNSLISYNIKTLVYYMILRLKDNNTKSQLHTPRKRLHLLHFLKERLHDLLHLGYMNFEKVTSFSV